MISRQGFPFRTSSIIRTGCNGGRCCPATGIAAPRQRRSLCSVCDCRCASAAKVAAARQRQSLQLQAIETDYKKNE